MRNQFHLDSSDYTAKRQQRSKPRSFSWILTLLLCLCFLAGGTLAVYYFFQVEASSSHPPPSDPIQPETMQTTEQLYSHQQPMMEPISPQPSKPGAIQVIDKPKPAQPEKENETPEQKEPATKPKEDADRQKPNQTDSTSKSDDQTRKPEKKPDSEKTKEPMLPQGKSPKPKQPTKINTKPKQLPKVPKPQSPPGEQKNNEPDPVPSDKPNELHNDLQIIFLKEQKEPDPKNETPLFVTTQEIDLEKQQLLHQEIPKIKSDAAESNIPIVLVKLPKNMSTKEREQWVNYFLTIAEKNHLTQLCITLDLEQTADLDFSLYLFFELLRYELAEKEVKLSFAVHDQNEKVQLSLRQLVHLSLLSEQVFVYSSLQNKEKQKELVLEPAYQIQLIK